MKPTLVLAALLLASQASGQTATVAVFDATATDPNIAAPIAPPVQYLTTCGYPVFFEVLPIVNPFEGYFANPDGTITDCRMDISVQMDALPDGSGYRIAVRLNSDPYGGFSSAFSIAHVVTPPPPPPPTAGCYDGATFYLVGQMKSWQFARTVEASEVARLTAAGWVLTRTKVNKKWAWYSGVCQG